MYLGKNLKYLRLKNGLSQDYVADYLGYKSYTTIQKWEMGTSDPPLGALSKMAALYRVDMDSLYLADLEASSAEYLKTFRQVPVLGTVAAGVPILAEENIENYIIVDKIVEADFALRVKGDSMKDTGIKDNDIVFVRQQTVVDNGDVAVVLIDNEATLKRFYQNDGGVILKPENSNYQPRYYSAVDFKDIKILGKAIMCLSKL